MAYQGLNVEGAPLVRVMPQYTPVNTALDVAGIGRGFEQGMGLVQQANQIRRARDLMLEEQARRPLRDLMTQQQMAEAQDYLSTAPERQRIASLERSRRGIELAQPIERVQFSFEDELPEGGGVGRYNLIERINPVTGQVEQINQFAGQVMSQQELEAAQAKAAIEAERSAMLAEKTAAEVAKLQAEAKDIAGGGAAARGRIQRGDIYQRTIEKTAGELGFTPDRMEKIYASPAGPRLVAKLRRMQGELGNQVKLGPDEEELLMSSYSDVVSTEPVGVTSIAPTPASMGNVATQQPVVPAVVAPSAQAATAPIKFRRDANGNWLPVTGQQ